MESVSLEILKIRQCLFYGTRLQVLTQRSLLCSVVEVLTKIIETLLKVSHTHVAFDSLMPA